MKLSAELVSLSGRAVVFCRSVPDTIRVASELSRIGVPAASVEHRDFSSSRVRARVVTDETALSCERMGTSCVIQFDPATTVRRYRRRIDLVAAPSATVVSFVVPEREAEVRRLLHGLDLPDVLTAPDLAVARDALLATPGPAPVESPGETRTRVALSAARRAMAGVPHGASRAGHAVGRRMKALARRRNHDDD